MYDIGAWRVTGEIPFPAKQFWAEGVVFAEETARCGERRSSGIRCMGFYNKYGFSYAVPGS